MGEYTYHIVAIGAAFLLIIGLLFRGMEHADPTLRNKVTLFIIALLAIALVYVYVTGWNGNQYLERFL